MPAASRWFRYPTSRTCSTDATLDTQLSASYSTRNLKQYPPRISAARVCRRDNFQLSNDGCIAALTTTGSLRHRCCNVALGGSQYPPDLLVRPTPHDV